MKIQLQILMKIKVQMKTITKIFKLLKKNKKMIKKVNISQPLVNQLINIMFRIQKVKILHSK